MKEKHNWTQEDIYAAYRLYAKLTKDEIARTNPELVATAKELGVSPDSLYLRLQNLVYLDPATTEPGLSHAVK